MPKHWVNGKGVGSQKLIVEVHACDKGVEGLAYSAWRKGATGFWPLHVLHAGNDH